MARLFDRTTSVQVTKAAGLLTAFGFLATGAHLVANSAATGATGDYSSAAMIFGVAGNLLASGIGYFCGDNFLTRGKAREDLLVNHHILDMVRLSTSEASAAVCRAYAALPEAPEELAAVLRNLSAKDFDASAISADEIRQAVALTRRTLLPAARRSQAPTPEQLEEVEVEFAEGLVDSILKTVQSRLASARGSQSLALPSLPEDLRPFLLGREGALVQLTAHVAMYLKSNEPAREAVHHAAEQQILDDQNALASTLEKTYELCEQIVEAQSGLSETAAEHLKQFERQVKGLSATVQKNIQEAFSAERSPPLSLPYLAGTRIRLDNLVHGSRFSAMIGREAATEALLRFLGEPDPVLWTVVSGDAGTGKSRLATELLYSLVGQTLAPTSRPAPPGLWRAGVLDAPAWSSGEGLRWCPEADTLLVIDSTSLTGDEFVEGLRRFLVHAISNPEIRSAQQGLKCRVRILLLDRIPPDADQGIARRLSGGSRTDNNQQIVASCRWRPSPLPSADDASAAVPMAGSSQFDPLDLQPLREADASKLIEAYVRSAAKRSLTVAERERVTLALASDPELSRPLFAVLIADSVANGTLPSGVLNPITVAQSALITQFAFLEAAGFPHLAEVKDLLVLATIGNGTGLDAALSDETARIVKDPPAPFTRTEKTQIRSTLERAGILNHDDWIEPLKPDFLGELFVLVHLFRLFEVDTNAAVDQTAGLMQLAWSHGRNPGGFLIRIASDFSHRTRELAVAGTSRPAPAAIDRAYRLLRTLFRSAATAAALGRGGAYTLQDVCYGCAIVASEDLARETLGLLLASPAAGSVKASAWFGFALSGDLPASMRARGSEALEAIRALHRGDNDPAVRQILADALFNRSNDLANAKRLDEALALLKELRDLHASYPEAAVREQLAKALLNLSNDLADDERLDEALALLQELHDLHASYPEAAVREGLAGSLYNRSNDLADAKRLDDALALLQELRDLHAKYPEAAVREWFAKSLYNRSNHLADAKRLDEALVLLQELRDLHASYPEAAARERLAKALLNLSNDLADDERLDEALALLQELHDLHASYPEAAVRERLAKALFNLSNDLANANRLNEALTLFQELHDLHASYPEAAVRERLAKSLYNRSNYLADAKRLDEALVLLKELRDLHASYPEAAVREILAKALVNLSNALANDERLGEALALLQELRDLHASYPEAGVREQLANALSNQFIYLGRANRFDEAFALINELRTLSLDHPADTFVQELLGKLKPFFDPPDGESADPS